VGYDHFYGIVFKHSLFFIQIYKKERMIKHRNSILYIGLQYYILNGKLYAIK